MDQVDRVIYDLKHNPFSRRILTNIYVHEDLHEMNLYPCAYSMTFNVTHKKGDERLTLNAVLNQRSQDVLAANNWNVCQYTMLIKMLVHSNHQRAYFQRAVPGTKSDFKSGNQRLLPVYNEGYYGGRLCNRTTD